MQKIEIPTCCPACSYKLELVNDQLFCRNTACDAQLGKKLEHFAKTLSIKGLGPKTLEKLDLQDITEIFYLDKDDLVSALGSEKVADKLLDEIERAKGSDTATVLASFAIPLVGNTASKKLMDTLSSFDEITFETCKAAGLGDKVSTNLVNWVNTDWKEMKEFLPFVFHPKPKQVQVNTNAKRVCITGKLKSFKKKADAESSLSAAGYILVDSVTKTTDFLIDEEGKMSSKREKAVSYGITIITDLNDLLKEKIND